LEKCRAKRGTEKKTGGSTEDRRRSKKVPLYTGQYPLGEARNKEKQGKGT